MEHLMSGHDEALDARLVGNPSERLQNAIKTSWDTSHPLSDFLVERGIAKLLTR
jgi:hypothetical protein